MTFDIAHWSRSPAGHFEVHEVTVRFQGPPKELTLGHRTTVPWDFVDPLTGEFGAVFSCPAGTSFTLGDEVLPPPPPALRLPELPKLELDPRRELTVAMSTFRAPPGLLSEQIKTLKSQTLENWRCVILNAGATSDSSSLITSLVGDDFRFIVVESPHATGASLDFIRLIECIPHDRPIALCDQDDRWHPEKLSKTLQMLSAGTLLAYCDMRVVSADSKIISNTAWSTRDNNYQDLVSLLLANTVTGAASVFQPEILTLGLPFPKTKSKLYHDQWLAVCALTLGDIKYVDEALYDYVQHPTQEIGHQGEYKPAFLRDAFNLFRILDSVTRSNLGLAPRGDILLTLKSDLMRIKHMALTARLRAGGRARNEVVRQLNLITRLPRDRNSELALWKRGLRRFGRKSDTVGNDWRLLAASLSA